MSGDAEKSPLYIPTDVVNAISSGFFRPGQTIQGSVQVRGDMLGTPDGFSQITVQLHTHYKLQSHTLKSEGRTNYAMGGMVYSFNSDWERHWDKLWDQVIASIQIYPEADNLGGGAGSGNISFAFKVPHDSMSLRVCPTVEGNIRHELYCVASSGLGESTRSNAVPVRLLPNYAPANTTYAQEGLEFKMKGPWIAADNSDNWEAYTSDESIFGRLLEGPSTTSRLLTKLSLHTPKFSRDKRALDYHVTLYKPKRYVFPIGKDVPFVVQYRVGVPEWVPISRVSWDEFLVPLPASGLKDAAEGYVVHWIISRIPKDQGGDGQGSDREHSKENLVRWSEGHLHDGINSPRIPSDTGSTFPLQGYGWSDPFQDPQNRNLWTRVAFVLGFVHAPEGSFECFASADGTVKTHSTLDFRQPKRDGDLLKGDPDFRDYAFRLRSYCQFSCVSPPSYD